MNGSLGSWQGKYELPIALRGYVQPDGSFENADGVEKGDEVDEDGEEVKAGPVVSVLVPEHPERDENGKILLSEVSVQVDGKPVVGWEWKAPLPLLAWPADKNGGVEGRLMFFRDFGLPDHTICNWISGGITLEGTGTDRYHDIPVDYSKGKPNFDVGGGLEVPPKIVKVKVQELTLGEKILIGIVAGVTVALGRWALSRAAKTERVQKIENAIKRTLESWKPDCCKDAGVEDGPPSLDSVELSRRDQRDSTAAEDSLSVLQDDREAPGEDEQKEDDDAENTFGDGEVGE